MILRTFLLEFTVVANHIVVITSFDHCISLAKSPRRSSEIMISLAEVLEMIPVII